MRQERAPCGSTKYGVAGFLQKAVAPPGIGSRRSHAPCTLKIHAKPMRHSVKQTNEYRSPQSLEVRAASAFTVSPASRQHRVDHELNVHCSTTSRGNATSRSIAAAPTSWPRWTTSNNAALLRQEGAWEGGLQRALFGQHTARARAACGSKVGCCSRRSSHLLKPVQPNSVK